MTTRGTVALRPVALADLDPFFQMMADPVAAHMAAFTWPESTDRTAFDARYQRVLANPTVLARTVVVRTDAGEQVVGSIARFDVEGEPEIGFWIDRSQWGQGIAGQALRLFLETLPERPLVARAAADNAGSLRVLERAGFRRVGSEWSHAHARAATIEEIILRLDPADAPLQPGQEEPL